MKKIARKLYIPLIALALFSASTYMPLKNNPTYAASTNTTGKENLQAPTLDKAAKTLQSAVKNTAKSPLPEAVFASYYAGQNASAFEYFQHSSIQRFLAMWVKEKTGDITNPEWNLDSFAQICILDHDFVESRPDEALYYCTFSDGAERYGYAIVKYHEADPSISNWSIQETTPDLYDLKANAEEIAESLKETDIDLSTATASRVYLFDRERNRADQVIRFTDAKGDNYILYFGDSTFEVEKWN